jgi:aminopeptidase
MADIRAQKFAQIIVDYSTHVQPGEKVAITCNSAVLPVAKELYRAVLQRGAYPHVLLDFSEFDEILLATASDEQLDYTPIFHKMAFEDFNVLIKLRSEVNTRALTQFDPARNARWQRVMGGLVGAQMRRGAIGELRWMSTQAPTQAYAMEAEMGLEAYEDYFYGACYATADTSDPVAAWKQVRADQQRYIDRIQGHDQVHLRGPNVDLKLSIKGRTFNNACGIHNLPDGEIYTGPVEDSANGWVHFTYPSVYEGQVVSGIRLKFENGRVVDATSERNQEYMLSLLNTDAGARYLGEFAIGLNYSLNRSTKSILLDEKIGGSFHMAVGAGYPETGSVNRSLVHWDMICDMRREAEMLVDGEVVYRNGAFLF